MPVSLVCERAHTHIHRISPWIRHVISHAHFIFQLGITDLVVAFIYWLFVFLMLQFEFFWGGGRERAFSSATGIENELVAIAFTVTVVVAVIAIVAVSFKPSIPGACNANSSQYHLSYLNMVFTYTLQYLVIHRSFIWQ